MILSKDSSGMVFAWLVAIFVTATALFAAPAWSQRSDPIAGKDVFVQRNIGSGGTVDLGDILRIRGNFKVEDDATVTLRDRDGTRGTLEDGVNAEIRRTDNGAVVIDVLGEPNNVRGGNGELNIQGLEGVSSTRISLVGGGNGGGGNGGGGNGGGGNGDGKGKGPNVIIVDPDDEDEDGDEDEDEEGSDDDEDGDGDANADDDLAEAEADLADEGETTDDGVSASADEDGAEASTPGAVASVGGDPDEQAPVSGQQGDVVDEIPISGPLPNTGGAPVATGAVIAMVVFGLGLLAVRLVMIWRERRTQ